MMNNLFVVEVATNLDLLVTALSKLKFALLNTHTFSKLSKISMHCSVYKTVQSTEKHISQKKEFNLNNAYYIIKPPYIYR
jgi:hypothetical protein